MAELSQEDINRIAEAVVEKAAEDVGVRDIMIGSAMGKGAIPLYGRETRKEPCSCCLIDPEGPNAPDNRMCTTKGAIGTLSDREEREWCSEINIVSDGRCARAMAIREAARECKEKHPEDTEAFFRCYIPAFSQITKGNNPGRSYCGICDEYFDNWYEHVNSPKHKERAAREAEAARIYTERMKEEGNLGEYVTITDPGKTTFKPGEVVFRLAFEKENERVKKLGEKPATGR